MKRTLMFFGLLMAFLLSGLNAQAVNVYFKNTVEWNTVKIHIYKNVNGSDVNYRDWADAPEMTKVGGLYKFEIPAGFENGSVVFKDDSGHQYPSNGGYEIENKTKCYWDGWNEFSEDPYTVYFDNTNSKWNPVKIYFNGGLEEPVWNDSPEMTFVKGNIYKYDIPAGTNLVIFHNGNGTQTANLSPVGNHVFTKDGDQGEYVDNNEPQPVVVPEKLYIMGNVNGTSWDTTKPVTMTKNGNKFTAKDVMFANGSEADAYFNLSTAFGKDWGAVNAGDRYGAAEEDVAVTPGDPVQMTRYVKDVNASSCKSWKVAKGQYDVTVDFDANTVTLTKVAAGEGQLSAADVKIKARSEATLEISLTNSKTIAGLRFDVKYPGNVTSGTPTLLRTTSNTMKAEVSKQADGSYRYIVYDGSDLTGFTGNEGVIMQIPLSASATALPGEYELVFTEVQYSTPTGELVKPGNFTGRMIVEASEESTYLELNYKVLSLKVGGSKTLVAKVMPGEEVAEGVAWTSDNSAVAIVDNNGVVTAKANGKATITATAGDMKAVCDVYVGKEAQTITWGEMPAKIEVGDELTLNATSSSDLAVTYTIVEGNTLAHITDGKLVAEKTGVVIIEANQAGDDTYAPANPETVTVTIWLGHDMGDVTMNDVVDINDVTAVVEHMLNNTLLEGKALLLADMNANDEIDIADVVMIVNSILTQPVAAADRVAAARMSEGVEEFEMSVSGNLLNIRFSNMHQYVATQFLLTLPEGVEVVKGQVVGSSHTAAVHNLGEGYARVVVYSLENEKFNEDGSISLKLTRSNIEKAALSNALIGTPDTAFEAKGASYVHTTGIVAINADANDTVSVYNLNGVCVYEGTLAGFAAANFKGVYVVKTAEEAVKVVL